MYVLIYLFVFLASLLVDIVPLIGPPAWTVMVFFQIQFHLNIWLVLITGVTGSAIGRYLYSAYVPIFSRRFIKPNKNADLQFIGNKLASNGWKIQLFVLLYTLMPLPSTPLFTAAGAARIKTFHILPAFFVGKFCSDAAMVISGNYVINNVANINFSFFTWKSLSGIALGIILICFLLFINWKKLLMEKKFTLTFNIWK
jgi:membrane protein DedA with SNARE-associated domain